MWIINRCAYIRVAPKEVGKVEAVPDERDGALQVPEEARCRYCQDAHTGPVAYLGGKGYFHLECYRNDQAAVSPVQDTNIAVASPD